MNEDNELQSSNAKCKNCGSNLVYDPGSKALKCFSCDSIFRFNLEYGYPKHSFDEKIENGNYNLWIQESKTVRCKTCGAKIVVSGLEVTQKCPYCDSDYVLDMEDVHGLQPDSVLPFEFSAKRAEQIFIDGVKKKFFVPRGLKKSSSEHQVIGIYAPSFLFDAKTRSTYKGALIHEKTYYSNGKTRIKHEIEYIKGVNETKFTNLIVEASSKMNYKQMHSILPYNMGNACNFDVNFLRGYSAEQYEDDLDICYKNAKREMQEQIKRNILSQYSYSSVQSLNVDTKYSDELYSYVLFPVYCLKFVYNKKSYLTVMNGQTGKIGSGLPVSKLKIASIVIIVAIIIIVIAYFSNVYTLFKF